MAFSEPTFTFPNGGESVFGRVLNIAWSNPSEAAGGGLQSAVWYEIYFTADWDAASEPNWTMIAEVTSTATGFDWVIPAGVKGSDCRLAVRYRDRQGFRGDYILNGDVFSIQQRTLTRPALISPVSGETYRQFIPIIINHEAVLGTTSQRATYQIYYSSASNSIDWTLITGNLHVGSEPVYWDTRELPPGTDYDLKVTLEDDDGNSSVPAFIRDISIQPISHFILDTTPPKGHIEVEGNVEFTSNRNLVLRLSAFDEATGVRSVQIRENFGGTVTDGLEQEMANIKTWFIAGDADGTRCIEALFKDYAGNTVGDDDDGEFFRSFLSNSNAKVSAFLAIDDGSDEIIWTAFAGSSPTLFRNRTTWTSLPNEATHMALFDGSVYLSTKDEENVGRLYLVSSNDVDLLNSFSSADTAVTAMAVYDSKLYMGLQNGEIYSYNGSVVSSALHDFGEQIESMQSNGTALIIGVESDANVYAFDGVSSPTALGIIDAHRQV